MTTALVLMLAFAAADLLLCGAVLVMVGMQYRAMRRVAAVNGHPLPSAAGQFAILGLFLVVGLVVMAVTIRNLMG